LLLLLFLGQRVNIQRIDPRRVNMEDAHLGGTGNRRKANWILAGMVVITETVMAAVTAVAVVTPPRR
jgi:hypothetical protein